MNPAEPHLDYRCLACGLRETCAACQAANRPEHLDEFGTPPLFAIPHHQTAVGVLRAPADGLIDTTNQES